MGVDQADSRVGLLEGRMGIDSTLWCLMLIVGCFTLTSEGYIGWFYNLMSLNPSAGADWHALVGNYAFQGVGMALAALYMHRRTRAMEAPLLLAVLVLHLAFAAPAALATAPLAAVVFGYLMALSAGAVQAFYLSWLVLLAKPNRRGTAFGVGYACSSGLTWLLSLARGAVGSSFPLSLAACLAFTAVTAAFLVLIRPDSAGLGDGAGDASPRERVGAVASDRPDEPASQSRLSEPVDRGSGIFADRFSAIPGGRASVALACAAVLLMSLEKSLGFGFPPSDIELGVSVEFSRLFYAAGLVVAGIVYDYNRFYGAVCGMAAMVTPFAMLALSGEPVSGTVLWSLDYLLSGFFALFRAMLFLDFAEREAKVYLAGFGLMFGRLGDAAGNALCLSLDGNNVALVGLAGIALVCAILMAVQLFTRLQGILLPAGQSADQSAQRMSDDDRFALFARYFDLTRREQEVLREVLARHTNVEAAEALFVSESTIKFHMRNLLKKTGCDNRVELRDLYAEWHPS